MVLNVEKNIDTIRVVSGKNKPTEISVRPGSDRACFAITLNMGLNTVELLGLNQGKVVDRKEIKIFFRSDLFPKFRKVPAGFERYFFHFVDNEKSCASCHDMEPTLSSLRPETPEESPCYTCHANKSKHTFTHYPSKKGICFSCHEVLQGKQKYIASKPDEKVCYTCHASLIKEGKKRESDTAPLALAIVPSATTRMDPSGHHSCECILLTSASTVTRTKQQAPMLLQVFSVKDIRCEGLRIRLIRIGNSPVPAAIIPMLATHKTC